MYLMQHIDAQVKQHLLGVSQHIGCQGVNGLLHKKLTRSLYTRRYFIIKFDRLFTEPTVHYSKLNPKDKY